jgi:hypothetical protein
MFVEKLLRWQLVIGDFHRFCIDTLNFGKAEEFMEISIIGGRQYCVNDPLSTLPTARAMLKM